MAEKQTKMDHVRDYLKKHGMETPTGVVVAALAEKNVEIDGSFVRKAKRQLADAKETETPQAFPRKRYQPPSAKKPDQSLGAGRETAFRLFEEKGYLPYEEALPILKASGGAVGAEWYRRLCNEHKAIVSSADKKVEPLKSAGPTPTETPAKTEPPRRSVVGAVMLARQLIETVGKEEALQLIEVL